MNRIQAALLTAAIAALPVQASAVSATAPASADRAYTLRTRIVEQAPSVGEFDGSLQVHVSPDGILSGYYRPDDNPRFIPVTGGIAPNKQFWIDIGTFSNRPVRFSGTFVNGKITAYSNGPIFDDGELTGLTLTGSPAGK